MFTYLAVDLKILVDSGHAMNILRTACRLYVMFCDLNLRVCTRRVLEVLSGKLAAEIIGNQSLVLDQQSPKFPKSPQRHSCILFRMLRLASCLHLSDLSVLQDSVRTPQCHDSDVELRSDCCGWFDWHRACDGVCNLKTADSVFQVEWSKSL